MDMYEVGKHQPLRLPQVISSSLYYPSAWVSHYNMDMTLKIGPHQFLLKIRKINRFLVQNSNLEIWGETKNRAILSVYRSVFLVYQMVFGRFFLNSIFK
jgi:hypothetical protein